MTASAGQGRSVADVIVVGGGPGGSTLARTLVTGGMDVIVVDKADFPRDKTCAGWVTPPVFEALSIDPADYGQDHTLQPITSFLTGLIGGPVVQNDYDQPVSYGIRRREFDAFLLERAGARVMSGESVRSIEHQDGLWRINGRFEAPLLVGAGGHFCPVSRFLGNPTAEPRKVVAAQEYEIPLPAEHAASCAVEPHRPELYFCPDLLGYGWCFRKGDFLNVGLGREDDHGLADHVHAFVDMMKDHGRLPRELNGKMKGHAYILWGHLRRKLTDDGVLLVGDAAGLAYARSGEGIRPAVESGLMAGRVILEAQGRPDAASFARYERMLSERFGDPDRAGAASLLPAGLHRFLGRALLRSARFNRHVVIDRWFLNRSQPALAV